MRNASTRKSTSARTEQDSLAWRKQFIQTLLERDLLTDALMLRQLQPWHANLGKRQVKSPKVTPSIRTALADLGLERVAIVYPGNRRYPSSRQVEAVPLETLAEPGGLFGRTEQA
jgi:predicted AAA+ superfamily ATPase